MTPPTLPWPPDAAGSPPSPSLSTKLAKMARTRRVLDRLARLTRRRPPPDPAAPPRRIGVLLLWGIGDAILAQPLLGALRARWPDARIEAIGRPFLPALLGPDAGVDACRPLIAPWIAHRGKYKIWTRPWRAFRQQLRDLAATPYDLLITLRLDPRETLLLRWIGAGKIAGQGGAGGAAWLDIDFALPADRYEATARGAVAVAAGATLTGATPDAAPHLRPRPAELAAIHAAIRAAGPRDGPVLGVCFGGSHPLRRWDAAKIGAAVAAIADRIGLLVVIEDAGGETISPPVPPGVPTLTFRGDLARLTALCSQIDLLFCADSGVMHLAAATGTPCVAVFGPGSLDVFRPHGPGHRVVCLEPMPCRPCWDNCHQPRPICLEDLPAEQAAQALAASLADVRERRIDSPLPSEPMA